jgi:hypothetical protein
MRLPRLAPESIGTRCRQTAERALNIAFDSQTMVDDDPTNGGLTSSLSGIKNKITKLQTIGVPAETISQRE